VPWQEIRFEVQQHQLERIEKELESHSALSISLEDAGDQPILEPLPGTVPVWDSVTVIALFESDSDIGKIKQSLSRSNNLLNWEVNEIPDQDWERSWMDQFEPIQIGDNLWICPSWRTPPVADAVNLILDPGLAFGSGTHPTTRLCLKWLDKHPPLNLRLIDYGCGSGILALAGLLLGAEHAIGIDIDPQALRASRDNADKNSIPESVLTLYRPEEPDLPMADILVANILSGPLITLAPKLAKLVGDNGTIILSGILENQIESVIQAYRDWFTIMPWACEEGWACLTGKKV